MCECKTACGGFKVCIDRIPNCNDPECKECIQDAYDALAEEERRLRNGIYD